MRALFYLLILAGSTAAHPIEFHTDPFRQLEEAWPTPTETRIATGQPGPQYWQQRADYRIQIQLNEDTNSLTGKATISYYNNSPHTLEYLWVQLDRNRFHPDSLGHQSSEAPDFADLKFHELSRALGAADFDGSFKITAVTGATTQALPHRIVDTMMRVDLPQPLTSQAQTTLNIDWHYELNDYQTSRSRSAWEEYDDKNKVYEIAQWFPRIAAYSDVRGWHNKAFLGRGEFALEFGDYHVEITVPDDHVVTATGVLQNPKDCLKPTWIERLKKAESATEPVFIITPEEAKKNESSKPGGTQTWTFAAQNVRDFAWASSRKFIWDAVLHKLKTTGKPVWAMSLYPNEAEPLWSQYSTHAVIHTLDVYSKFTIDYPYPVAISVNGPVWGMEYPMICFNGPKPEKDGTYSEKTKRRLISIVIHEVGHNWFPMIINSDERQWTWMDEGLNSFVQTLAEYEWTERYPSRADPRKIGRYMTSKRQRPIMTQSESIFQFGPNAYTKPATALVVLRETILGREIFDDAFKRYCEKWAFKRPEPSDFFRAMEDAAGVDLDWFWHGWFYTTGHVDLAVTNIQRYLLDDGDPQKKKDREKEDDEEQDQDNIAFERDRDTPKYVKDKGDALHDFYDAFDKYAATEKEKKEWQEELEKLEPYERDLLKTKREFHVATFENKGGLVMPLLLEIHYEKKPAERLTLPAEIWKKDQKRVRKLFVTDEKITRIVIDPRKQTADTNTDNNSWPQQIEDYHFTLSSWEEDDNPMREAKEAEKEKEETE